MNEEMKGRFYFAVFAAVTYLFFALLQFLAGIGISSGLKESFLIPADIMGAFLLFVVSAVFLAAVKEMNAGIKEGLSYVYVGIIIALIFSAVYLLIFFGDAFAQATSSIVGSEGAWNPPDSIRPILYLGIIPLIAFLRWKGRFTLKEFEK